MKKLLSLFMALPLVAILMFSTLVFAAGGDLVIEGKNVEVSPKGIAYGASYFPDYNETDQGVAGDGRSTKDYVDTIAANSATLVFQHNSGAATTTYTFGTSETVPSNINVIIEKGAILNTDLSIRNATYKWTQSTKSQLVEDCEDAWNESVDADVTSTADTGDYQVGAASAKLVVADAAAAGDILATEAIASLDISGYTYIRMWIKSSVVTAAGDLQLLLDDTASCASPLETIDVPILAADTWTQVNLALAARSSDTAIISVGLKYTIDIGACTIRLDDLQATSPYEYYLELAAGGDPGISTPSHCAEDNSALTKATAGILAVSQWDWADNDTLGYSTVYVRLSDGADPDGKATDFVKTGYILTINNMRNLGLYQVFSGNGSVNFGNGAVKECYPEWWGAVNVTGTDNSTAITSALASGVNICVFQKGTYDFATGFTLPEYHTVKGVELSSNAADGSATTLKYTGTGVAITVSNVATLKDFQLNGNALATGGIHYGPATVNLPVTERVGVINFTKTDAYGIRLNGLVTGTFRDVRPEYNYYGMVVDGDSTNTIFDNCQFRRNDKYGSYITDLRGSTFVDCLWESNYDSAMVISGAGAYDLSFYGGWAEGNCWTSGTSDVIVTGGAGDLAHDIKFYNWYTDSAPPYHNPGTGWSFLFDYAENCGLIFSTIHSFSYLSASAHTVNCYVLTAKNGGAADNNHANGIRFYTFGDQYLDLANNSTTPSIGGLNIHRAYNTNPTTITNFVDGTAGQILTVYLSQNATIEDGGNFSLERDIITGGIITLFYDGTVWREINRKNNPCSGESVITTDSQIYVIPNTDSAIIFLTDVTANKSAIYSLNGSADTTTELADPDNGFTPATGATIWVRNDGAGSYRIKNEYAVTHTIRWTLLNQLSR